MLAPISKTNFLDFLFCPKNLWLKLNKPELLELFELSDYEQHLADEGNEVEAYARSLFPGGVEVKAYGQEAALDTTKFIATGVPSIFQATFIVDGFQVRSDVLEHNEDGTWNLYEVKGTSGVNDGGSGRNHIDDLAFQSSVLRRSGINVENCYVMHLNNEYVRFGELKIEELFVVEDVTEKVEARMAAVEDCMAAAHEYLGKDIEPLGGCECVYKGRSAHCTTFAYSNPHVPAYSVHDLSRIGLSKKKLAAMVEGNIFDLADVPEHIELSDTQTNQIKVHLRGSAMIDTDSIAAELSGLQFPLYFLDYETFSPAVPLFDGYRPFDKVPFQFSLHILESADAEPTHVEYLHMDQSDPSEAVVALLEEHIGPEGTIVAWNKSFEMDVHKKLAARLPERRAFLERTITQFYDLKDVFHKQYFVHPEFRGSVSIKKVLPALVPSLQYKELGIHGGAQASDAWWTMVAGGTSDIERNSIAGDLKTYCKLDTYAMYAIWKYLDEMI
ncbi:MAG: hypothetical protein JWO43_439 [Candidatus Adlerbacteria bacterium]|nr:hypothetical protein [Candidatus Adlerbacteria bacterium]